MEIPVSMPTQKYQIALFPTNLIGLGEQNWNQIFSALVAIPQFSDGENFIIPLPQDAPTSAPRVILKSSNGSLSCIVSSEKVEIFWNNPSDEALFSVSIEDRISLIGQIVDAISSTMTFKRVGTIHNFYFLTQENDPVISEILQANIVSDLQDYGLRLVYPESLEDVTCNYVFDLTHGLQVASAKSVLIIQSDFNTKPEAAISWNLDQLGMFIANAETYLDKENIFRRLFPR